MIVPARRRFLLGAAAFLAAPSIVKAATLMPVSARWGDDTAWLQKRIDEGALRGFIDIPHGTYRVTRPLQMPAVSANFNFATLNMDFAGACLSIAAGGQTIRNFTVINTHRDGCALLQNAA